MVLERCRDEIDRTMQQLWPGIECAVRLTPLLDLTRADLSSDCCMLLARRLRERPEWAAARLIEALPAEFPGSCHCDHDFLNIRLSSLGEAWPCLAPPAGRLAIVLPPAPDCSSPAQYLRLLGAAAVQAMCAHAIGAEYVLYLGALPAAGGAEALCLQGLYSEAAAAWNRQGRRGSQPLAEELSAVIEREAGALKTVWLTPSSLHKRDFNGLYHSMINGRRDVLLKCPERGWLAGAEELWGLAPQFPAWSEQRLAALSLYLCGNAVDSDFDPFVAEMAESANLLWFLSSAGRRVAQAAGAQAVNNKAGTPDPTGLPDGLRMLTLRAFLLPYFFERAACFGEVREYAAALEDLLKRVVRMFNDPAYRVRAARGAASPVEGEIMAGVCRVLSDTISYWKPWLAP